MTATTVAADRRDAAAGARPGTETETETGTIAAAGWSSDAGAGADAGPGMIVLLDRLASKGRSR
jgi:hypothetical protein